MIIALPEEYTKFNPQTVLDDFTNLFRRRYEVECISALHHNKKKTNYHIHLIFSERRLLDEPDIKTATRSVFYDETGKRVRTKKEITDNNGNIRKGCRVIKKGEVYERHLFSVKDELFKSDAFLHRVKTEYTDIINRNIRNEEHKLKVFDSESIYLPTKKIGNNNPKESEIEADNKARQEWNSTADMALLSGIEETKILEIKKEEIQAQVKQSIKKNGWLPGLFRSIVSKAKDLLLGLIRQTALPTKPVLNMNINEFRIMQKLMTEIQSKAKEIRRLQDTVVKLNAELAEAKGIFKTKERKSIEEQIEKTEERISELHKAIPEAVKKNGYSDVQTFTAAYRKAEDIVKQYNRELAEWESRTKPNAKPPQRESVRSKLKQLQAETKQKKKHVSFDRDR